MGKNIFFLITLLSYQVLYANEIRGCVKDREQTALKFATVRLQATPYHTTTDNQGCFKIENKTSQDFEYITAAKDAYAIGGEKFVGYDKNYSITLEPLILKDNSEYIFTPSLQAHISDKTRYKKERVCEKCNVSLLQEWQADRHSRSALNQNFLAVYEKGFKKDFPTSNGNCANCHSPVASLKNKRAVDVLQELSAVEKESISCDFCHKIKDVNLQHSNFVGVENIEFLRPNESKELLFGPMNDVFPRFDSYAKVYEQSKYCASCHNGMFWNNKVYSEYEEWKRSPYPKNSISCQKCHMPQKTERGFLAEIKNGGHLRSASEIHSHKFLGIKDEAFMRDALHVDIKSSLTKKELHVDIALTNSGAGHNFPTGSPFRSMILEVSVKNEKQQTLEQLSTLQLPSFTGIKGNGKVFAKIYRPLKGYNNNRSHFKYAYPEHFWRPIVLESDTSIPAKKSDLSKFIFERGKAKKVDIHVKIIYTNFFKPFAKAFGLNYYELLLYEKHLQLGGGE